MNLKSAKLAIPNYKKVFFGGGGLFSAAEACFLMLFLPYMSALSLPIGVIIPIAMLAILLPCFIMPLVYAIINGSTAISTGRYHLPLVICSLLACLLNVLLFSLHALPSYVLGFLLFICLFLLSLAIQIYFYVYCSIATRMDASTKTENFKLLFTLIGIIIAVGLVFWLYDGSIYSISQIAYIVSTIAVVSLVLVYMSSYTAMPFFIRIEPASNYTLKQNYLRYLAPVKSVESRRALISVFLISAADILGIMCYWLFGEAIGLKGFNLNLGVVFIFLAIVIFLPIIKILFKKNSNLRVVGFGILAVVLLLLSSALFLTLMFLNAPLVVKTLVLYLSCGIYGLISAILIAMQKPLHAQIKTLSGASFGNVYSLICAMLMVGLSLAVGVGLAGILLSRYMRLTYVATILASVLCVVMVLAIIVLCFSLLHRRKKDSNVDG